MKKKIKKILILLILIFVIFMFYKLFKKQHHTIYKINDYSVEETFYIKNKNHWYDLIINDKKNTFIFSLNKKIDKKKTIIKNIKIYKKNDVTCILPIYKKKVESNLICNYKNKQISNDYLQKENNSDFNEILKKSKIKLSTKNSTKTKYKNIYVYKNNIENNHKYIIWAYKGIYILDKNEINYKKIIDYDIYDNLMATVVDYYYVLFENTSVNGIEKIYYYNIKKDKLDSFKLDKKINKDSYINGVVDNKIYITDKKDKKEYCLNIKKKELNEVGNEEKGYLKYLNEEKQILTKSDFFMKNQYFENETIKDNTLKYKDLKKEYNYYYYLDNNKMYKSLEKNKKHSILLFELNDIKEWRVIDRNIIIVSGNSLYLYNEQTGLKKILESNELTYNYKNICSFWKK